MKLVFYLTVLLIGSALATEQLQGDIRKCASDIQDLIKLAEKIKADYKNGDLANLINDAALLVNVGQRVSQDCNFQSEIAEEFSVCFQAVQNLIKKGKDVKKGFLSRNSMQELIESINQFSRVRDECPQSEQEVSDRLLRRNAKNMNLGAIGVAAPSMDEIATIVEKIDFQSFRPIACAQDTWGFAKAAIKFLREVRNDTTEQVLVGIFGLLERAGPLLDDCGIQVPAWLNETVVIEACVDSVVKGVQIIEHTIADYNSGNSTLVVIEDVIAFARQALLIKETCSPLINKTEHETLLAAKQVQWTPVFPFNITDCLQATTDFSSLFGKLWTAINQGQSTGNIITDVSKIVIDVEPLLRTCGQNNTANFIAKEVPEQCLVSISDVIKVGADIYEHRENTLYVLSALAQLYQTVVKLRDNCPFLQGVIPELPEYDFENHQRIEKELKAFAALSQEESEEEQTSEHSTKLFKFNVTNCIKSSEALSAEFDNFKTLFMVENSKKDVKSLTESVIRLKELLHVFLSSCGQKEREQMLEDYLPTKCVNSVKGFLNLADDAVNGNQILPELIEMLPFFYLSILDVESSCPKITEKFQRN